ncbi:hypothetical protein ACQEVZ_42655 [Dactylosporangium sp. CA-152071]|uniref:hypothetical protein n=1 Tax=Dactylosporangium sp. CA-152071 TaxID=3239933 RepID=UPI003D8CEA11
MRRNLLRLLGVSLAAAVVILYINSIDGGSGDTGPDPAGRLQCASGTHVAAAYATAAPTSRETRTPEQLATAWATVRSKALLAGLHTVYEQPDRIDIAFDAKAHTVAVLTFRSHEPLGWHLEAVVACQSPLTQRSGPQSPQSTQGPQTAPSSGP